MNDFTSVAEICFFNAVGKMRPATQMPLRSFDLSTHARKLDSIGVQITVQDAYLQRLVNTFHPATLAPGGGDVAFIP